jgi:hypothetical protein
LKLPQILERKRATARSDGAGAFPRGGGGELKSARAGEQLLHGAQSCGKRIRRLSGEFGGGRGAVAAAATEGGGGEGPNFRWDFSCDNTETSTCV